MIMRKELFQLETIVDKEYWKVYKKTLTEKSIDFLQSFITKHKKLSQDKIFTKNQYILLPVSKTKDLNCIEFPYINGFTYEEILLKEDTDTLLSKYEECIESFSTKKMNKKEAALFECVFWQSCLHEISLSCGIVDLLLSNMILESWTNNTYIIDYEWVFNFPIPKKYVIWRALKKSNLLHRKKILKNNKISFFDEIKFLRLEDSFRKYVHHKPYSLFVEATLYYVYRIYFYIKYLVT